MRKVICIILTAGLIFSLLGCSAKTDAAPDTKQSESDTQNAVPTDPGMAAGYGDPTQSEDVSSLSTQAEEWRKPTVTAAWEDEADVPAAALLVTADNSETAVRLVLTTDVPVRDFCILRLTDPNIDDDGNLSFTTELVYNAGTFTPDRPIVLVTAFYGDLPNNGVSYTDETGATRTYALDISGMDGSLLLTEL